MSKLNKTFQRLRREKRFNFTDISEKCNIPLKRVEELDNDEEFTNLELASICDALGISIENFIKISDSTRLDSPYLIKVNIKGNPEESELYETICHIESKRMNNVYDPVCQGWRHNSYDEALVVLENARNMLSCTGIIPPKLHVEGYSFAYLTYLNDHAYIGGDEVVSISFGRNDDLVDSIDFTDDRYDYLDEFRIFDDDLY